MKKKTIADEILLYQYDSDIWDIMGELRAAEGLDQIKMKQVFSMLEQIKAIYEKENQIDKIVFDSFITIPFIYNNTRRYVSVQ